MEYIRLPGSTLAPASDVPSTVPSKLDNLVENIVETSSICFMWAKLLLNFSYGYYLWNAHGTAQNAVG